MSLQHIKIKDTDIILQDFEFGGGKLIISNNQYDLSYTWGAMSTTLKEFLLRINSDYFVRNMTNVRHDPMCAKSTMKAIRKAIASELPWYKYMAFQKNLRMNLKIFQSRYMDNEREFVDCFSDFHKELDYYLIEDKYDRKDVEGIFESICTQEPWHFIETTEHPQKKWLAILFKDLVVYLKSELKEISKVHHETHA
jgi:hypothetical protein